MTAKEYMEKQAKRCQCDYVRAMQRGDKAAAEQLKIKRGHYLAAMRALEGERVGRCSTCENWYKGHCASGPCATEETEADFYCAWYGPKAEKGEEAVEV